jgi:DNA-binding LacI/PurR family transcriptional regulator
VPADISVIGFDDVFGADFCHPPLTTLGERTAEAGARATALLTQQVTAGTRNTPARVLPTQLVVRASSGPAPERAARAAAAP